MRLPMHVVLLILLILSAAGFAGPALPIRASPGAAVEMAALDIQTVPDSIRDRQGYLWHPGPEKAADEFEPVLKYHVNQISRSGAIRPPVRVAPLLWRVDFLHYGWDKAVWEKMAQRNYVFVERRKKPVTVVVRGKRVKKTVVKFALAQWLPSEAAATLALETVNATPIVPAPWFVANTSRQLTLTNEQLGYGYYDWLGVKKPQDFLDLSKVRLKDSIALGRDVIDAVDFSGVSEQSRSVEKHASIVGSVFYTRDTDNDTGKGNAVQNLERDKFKAKAREWYIPLPNGLPGFMLSDDELKELQASAPDFIGDDVSPLRRGNDGRIHVGIACIRCHSGDVLRPVDGWVRGNFTADKLGLMQVADFVRGYDEDFAVFETLQRQFMIANLNNELNDQRNAYRFKIREASGLATPGELAAAFAREYHKYVTDPVTVEQAALEWGHPVDRVRAAFRKEAVERGVSFELAGLALAKSKSIKRTHYEDFYAEGQRILLAFGKEQP